MVKTNDILKAISLLIKSKYPDRMIYKNRCPQNFKRPSFWLENVKVDTAPANFCTVKVTAYFSLTCFIKLTPYGDQDSLELTDVQDEITKLFRRGSVKVGDRSLVAKASTAGYDNDRSYVDIQFDFYDDIPQEEDNMPLMGDIDMELKEG